MATKKENVKALFSNTRSRIIIIFTLILVVAMMVIGFFKLHSHNAALNVSSGVINTPNIESIPGSLNQTVQYAALQQTQNIEQAKTAQAQGKSAIPTIIRSQAFGAGVQSVGAQGGQGSVGFATLARENQGGPQSTLWYQELKDEHCSRDSFKKAIAQGAVLSDLKQVCTCAQLKDNGYGLVDLKSLCPCPELKLLGFTVLQFKAANYNAGELRVCGFVACEERAAGFSAEDMKNAGYSDGELAGAGFTEADIARAGGLPDGVSLSDVQKAGCSVESLKKLRAAGVTASAIRRINGCSAAALKAAGYSAEDLKKAGFSAAELRAAGFTPEQLRQAGYSARDLLDAGFTPEELTAAGFSDADIATAEALLPQGITANDIKKAGCDIAALKRERLAGVSAYTIKKLAGCSAAALKAAGFTDADLLRAGFTPAEIAATSMLDSSGLPDSAIKAAGCDPEQLKILHDKGVSAKRIRELNGCSADALRKAGYNLDQLVAAGYSPAQLAAAGFTPEEIAAASMLDSSGLPDSAIKAAGCDPEQLKILHDKGVSAKRIMELNGCSADALRKAGYNLAQLVAAGYSPEQLAAAGFTPEEIAAASMLDGSGLPDSAIRAAGCDPKQLKILHDKGVSAKRIRELNGCSADALRKAGYNLAELAAAGYSPDQLLAAGFTPEELKAAGLALVPAGIIAAGRTADCSVASLKAARAMGVSAKDIKHSLGCSAAAMKAAGYTAAELRDAGYSAAELKAAGFSAAELKAAGFSAKELRAAGFTAGELKAAGFDAKSLKDAGFSVDELKAAGFSAAQLRAAGFSAAELKNAGFTAAELKQAGYALKDLKEAGFTTAQLKAAGFSGAELQAAGFSNRDSVIADLDNLPARSMDVPKLPSIGGNNKNLDKAAALQAANAKKLEKIMAEQKIQMADQRYQQKIQQRSSLMLTAANQMMQEWKASPEQAYLASSAQEASDATTAAGANGSGGAPMLPGAQGQANATSSGGMAIKMGDIIFAVIDTSVNSDEPGPILATVVSGTLKGSKLIGTFNLPSNADKMVISFNSLSIPGAPKTMSIAAFAIDPNTARTALSSETDHHYLSRYGALFASTFLEGFGNAFQSADTTITIGGTGGTQDTTVQNGIGRSALENAVIGLATVGKAWGQVAQQNMSRPTTVQVFSGTGIGVLFTQDVTI